MCTHILKTGNGAREMAQKLRALADLQLSVTPVPEDLTPFSNLRSHCIHMVYIHTCRQNIYTKSKKKNLKDKTRIWTIKKHI